MLNALFDLRHFSKFEVILKKFEAYYKTPQGQHHDNFRIHTWVYIHLAKINWHLMTGTFKEGLGAGSGDYRKTERICQLY